MIDNSKEYIVCSAVWWHAFTSELAKSDSEYLEHQPKNVDKGIVVAGMRHHNCISTAYYLGMKKGKHTQGFLTSKNRFVDRREAMKIAYEAGQIETCLMDWSGDAAPLFSEDIY